MADIHIQAPDGSIVAFPEGTSNDVMERAMRQAFPLQNNVAWNANSDSMQPSQSPPIKQIGLDKLFGGTQAQNDMTSPDARFLRGVSDAPNAIGQMLLHGAEAVSPGITGGADQYLDRQLAGDEATYQAARNATGQDGVDWRRMFGGMASTAPVAAALPAAGYLQAIGSGALSGTLNPVTGGDNFGFEKLKQAGIGGAAGLAGQFISRLLSPRVAPEVRELMDSGVTPTPGQVLGGAAKTAEEKMTSVPILGDQITAAQRRAVEDMNRAAYNRALEPIGEKFSGDVGRSGVDSVKDALSSYYNDTLKNAAFQADNAFGQDMANIAQMAKSLPGPQAKQFQSILQDKLVSRLGPNGEMSGDVLKGVESELSRIAKGYGKDLSFDNRQLGDAVQGVLDAFRANLVRNSPGNIGADLQKANLGYANYARVRDAASRVGGDIGIFTPSQLQGAVRAGDSSVEKGAFAGGNALMQDLSDPAVRVLGRNYPNSGTAGRIAQMNLLALGLGLGAGGIGALPYSRIGTKAFAAMMTERPDLIRDLGDAAAKYSAVPASKAIAEWYRSNFPAQQAAAAAR